MIDEDALSVDRDVAALSLVLKMCASELDMEEREDAACELCRGVKYIDASDLPYPRFISVFMPVIVECLLDPVLDRYVLSLRRRVSPSAAAIEAVVRLSPRANESQARESVTEVLIHCEPAMWPKVEAAVRSHAEAGATYWATIGFMRHAIRLQDVRTLELVAQIALQRSEDGVNATVTLCRALFGMHGNVSFALLRDLVAHLETEKKLVIIDALRVEPLPYFITPMDAVQLERGAEHAASILRALVDDKEASVQSAASKALAAP